MKLAQYGALSRERDPMIREAALLGIGPSEISRLTGLSRGRVSEIANAR